MNEFLQDLLTSLLEPLGRLLMPSEPFSLLSLAAAFVVAGGFFLVRRPRSGNRSTRGLLRRVLPRAIWRHPSTRLDLAMFVANILLWALIYGAAVVTSTVWRDFAFDGLTAVFGPGETRSFATWPVVALVTVIMLLAFDLGYWLGHWALHRVPALWEIHKVHHSAEVMTPFTEWRQNPLEDILLANTIALTLGVSYAATAYLLGPAAKQLTLFDANILVLTYFLSLHHLRHSHVWLPIGGVMGRILHSPAHHQIHHSIEPRHSGKNLSLFLSVWDWTFGTLSVPARGQRVRLGLGTGERNFTSVGDTYARPLVNAVRVLMRRPPIG